jgi:ATP synthase F1 complex assembly factor 1
MEQILCDCHCFCLFTQMFIQTFLAVQMPHMLFTGLEDYKARGTQASPYFTVSYYKEFAESKDLVLIRGDVVFASKLSDEEAKWLLETTQSFYLNDVRYKLVERFNKETHDFEFKDVLQALDMPGL